MVVRNLPSRTTQGELQQAQKLIFAGKAHAAAGDPRMQRIVNYLSERGFQSASQMVRQRDLMQQQQVADAAKGITEVSPNLFKYKDPKTGRFGFTSSREFAISSARLGKPEVTKEFQEKFRTVGASGIGSRTPQAFVREAEKRIAAREAEILRIEKVKMQQARNQEDVKRIKTQSAEMMSALDISRARQAISNIARVTDISGKNRKLVVLPSGERFTNRSIQTHRK